MERNRLLRIFVPRLAVRPAAVRAQPHVMEHLSYHFFSGLFKLMGRLPMRVLYCLSDVCYVLLFHVVRYRRRVVSDNLMRVFADRTPAWRRQVTCRFYHFFCDLVVEALKMMSASPEEMHRRIRFAHPDIWNAQYARGKTALIVMSHYGNWEWLATTGGLVDYPFVSLYHVLHNPVFERIVVDMRTRYGTGLLSMKHFYRQMLASMDAGRPVAYGFIADQAPKRQSEQQMMTFLGQETAVYTGVERLARRYDLAVIYLSVRRIRRGSYLVEDTLITADGASTDPGQITSLTMALLEQDILRAPEFWLWSHRRWKKRRAHRSD